MSTERGIVLRGDLSNCVTAVRVESSGINVWNSAEMTRFNNLPPRLPAPHTSLAPVVLSLRPQKMKDDSDGDKRQQIHHIQNLYAFNLFCQKRFDDSMQVFAKLGTGEPAGAKTEKKEEKKNHIDTRVVNVSFLGIEKVV